MAIDTSHAMRTGRETSSPVDDATYDLLQALVSKLEAIDAYEQYAHDGQTTLFNDLLADERRHAATLLEAVRKRLGRPDER